MYIKCIMSAIIDFWEDNETMLEDVFLFLFAFGMGYGAHKYCCCSCCC